MISLFSKLPFKASNNVHQTKREKRRKIYISRERERERELVSENE